MSSYVSEQSQTNLTHRLTNNRFDIRKLSASTTLSDVDCGKFLYIVFFEANITLTLPDASTCIGAEIRGMVTEEGTGNHTLTILAKSGQLIDGNGSAGVYGNVALGFPFTATSTGRNWCLVAGLGADGGTNLLSGALTQDLDMGGNMINNCSGLKTNLNSIEFSFNGNNVPTLIISKQGSGLDNLLKGNFNVSGVLSSNNPKMTFLKTSAFQAIDPNTGTEVSWTNQSIIPGSISIDGTNKRISFSTPGTYLVSWTISWQGSSDNHTVETWVNVDPGNDLFGQQKVLGNPDETIQTCTAVVEIGSLTSFISIYVKHSASIPLNIPRAVNTGQDTMQLKIYRLV